MPTLNEEVIPVDPKLGVVLDDPADQLSLRAKVAIRSFMIKTAIPSAVVLSVVSAVFGFLLNEWAPGEAYVKAYGEASKSILDTATAAAAALNTARK
jgi:hypothetical protein